jgi:hypothetical protein
MTMTRFAFAVLLGASVLAGCGGTPDPNAAKCPPKAVKTAADNRYFLDGLEEGRTPAIALLKKKGVARKATLEKPGENPLRVVFFQTGVPGCSWMASRSVTTAVVLKDGFVYRIGNERLRDMTDDGWHVREAAWPWQNYDFGYLPAK